MNNTQPNTYLNKRDTLLYTNKSESWLFEYHRQILLKYGLNWRSTQEEIEKVCNEIKKVFNKDAKNEKDFEWFNNSKYLPEYVPGKKDTQPNTSPKKEDTQKDTQKSTQQKENKKSNTVEVDSKYFQILEDQYAAKKELEADYRNKDNQINLIVENLNKGMQILSNRIKQLEAPKPEQEPTKAEEEINKE